MQIADLGSALIHWREDGDPDGVPCGLFANSLGTDLRLWDKIVPRSASQAFDLIRFDKRGHGLSSCPDGPNRMDVLGRRGRGPDRAAWPA